MANTAIRAAITAAPVAHFDESVTRVAGHNCWPRTAATAALTAYHIDEHGRSAKSIEAFGILALFRGVAIHDAYSPYRAYTDCLHALCNQHVIREATGIGEFDPTARADGWAADLIDLLAGAFRWVSHWRSQGHDELPQFKLNDPRRRYDAITDRALGLHHPGPVSRPRPADWPYARGTRKDEHLRFATDFKIEFTKRRRASHPDGQDETKVSNGFRTLTGAQTFLALRAYISTARKNGVRAIHARLRIRGWVDAGSEAIEILLTLDQPQDLYRRASKRARKILNQTFSPASMSMPRRTRSRSRPTSTPTPWPSHMRYATQMVKPPARTDRG